MDLEYRRPAGLYVHYGSCTVVLTYQVERHNRETGELQLY